MQEKVCLPQEPLHERTVLALPCHKLVDHPLRLQYYNQAHLTALTASIKANRLLEPILAQPLEDGNYQILNGHYRVRAVRRLRHKTILGQLYPCDRRTALIIFCTSNLLTKSLSPLEEALMMQGLVKDADFSLAEVGELWGHSKSWVSRRLKLLTGLDPQVKRELDAGHLRPRVAQELARLPQGNDQTRGPGFGQAVLPDQRPNRSIDRLVAEGHGRAAIAVGGKGRLPAAAPGPFQSCLC